MSLSVFYAKSLIRVIRVIRVRYKHTGGFAELYPMRNNPFQHAKQTVSAYEINRFSM